MLHDLSFSIVIVGLGKFGVFQLCAYLLFEVVTIILLFKYQVYSNRLQTVRQYLVQSIYLMIAGLVCTKGFKVVDDKSAVTMLLILSLTIIFIDIAYLLCKFLISIDETR